MDHSHPQPNNTHLAYQVFGLGRKSSPVAGGLLAIALGGALWWFLALRWSPPEQAGYFVAALGLATLIAEIANLGAGYVVIRYFPAAGELASPLVRTSLVIVSGVALAGVLLLSMLGRLITVMQLPPLHGWIAALVFLTALGLAWHALTESLLLADGRRRVLFIRSAAVAAGRILLLIGFFFIGQLTLPFLLLSYSAPFVLASLAIVLLQHKAVFGNFASFPLLPLAQIRSLAPYALQSYLGNVVGIIAPNLLPTLIILWLNPVATAQYGAMWTIAGLVMLVPTAISLTSLSSAARGKSDSTKIVIHGMWLIAAISVPAIVAILILANWLLPYLGPAYATISPLQLAPLLLGALCASFTVQIYTRARLIDQGLRLVIAGQSLQTVLVLGLAYLFTPLWGLLGISIAWLIGAGITLVFVLTFGTRYLLSIHPGTVSGDLLLEER